MQNEQFHAAEQRRLEALRAYRILDTPPEESFDRVTRLAARLFGVTKSSVSLVDADRVWFKSRFGISDPEIPRKTAFCSEAVHGQSVLVIPDAAAVERYRDYPGVRRAGIRFYAGAPLIAPGRQVLGTLCILDTKPREFSAEDERLLADLAVLVVDQLELRRVAEQLRQSSEDYRGLVDNSPVGVYRTSPDGRILMANPAILRMLGYDSLGELQRRNIEDEALVEERKAWRVRLEEAGEIAGNESVWLARDGHPVPVRESTRVVRDDNGQVLFYEGWTEDISLRKAAELERGRIQQLLQEIFHTVTDLLYVYDFETASTVYSNRTLASLLGYSNGQGPESLPDAGAAELIHPSDQARAAAWLASKDAPGIELRLRNANGVGSTRAAASSSAARRAGRHGFWGWFPM